MPKALGAGPRGRNYDGRHLMRYLKKKAGISPEEIARQEHVSLRAVYGSIQQIEIYEHTNSEGQLQLAVRDLIISSIPQAKETLKGLLTATETVEVKNQKTGQVEMVKMADKVTQIEGVRLLKSLVETTVPKGPAVQVAVSQTNQTANLGSAETYEERLRRLRAKAEAHNQLPAEVAAVPRAIDEGEEDDGYEDEEEDE